MLKSKLDQNKYAYEYPRSSIDLSIDQNFASSMENWVLWTDLGIGLIYFFITYRFKVPNHYAEEIKSPDETKTINRWNADTFSHNTGNEIICYFQGTCNVYCNW